jgi:hypothetical protein
VDNRRREVLGVFAWARAVAVAYRTAQSGHISTQYMVKILGYFVSAGLHLDSRKCSVKLDIYRDIRKIIPNRPFCRELDILP